MEYSFSTLGAILGLVIAIILIIRKVQPAYCLILGALVGGKAILLLLALAGSISVPAAAALSTILSGLAMVNSLRAFGLE